MPFKDLRKYLDDLEREGDLQRIRTRVDWDEEIGAVAEEAIRIDAGALLFENIKDHEKTHGRKLLINSNDTPKRMAITFGYPTDMPIMEMIQENRRRARNRVKPVMVKSGPCKEVIEAGDEVNLAEFPAPKLHAKDGGRYLQTYGGVVTKDPETGITNVGIYRGMIIDRRSLAFLFVPTQHWGFHGRKYRAMGKKMPMAVTIGSGPIPPLAFFSYSPLGVSEYEMAGAWAEEPIPLVRCETVDLDVPATSEIVLEGEMSLDPGDFQLEGPFGEYPGYYTSMSAELRPVFKINCVTHRKDPILDAAIPGMGPIHPMPNRGLISSALIWNRLEDAGIQGLTGVFVEPSQPAVIYISINKMYHGHAKQVGTALWGLGLNYTGKYTIVTDSDVDVSDASKVMAAVANRTQGIQDFVVCQGTFGGILDPGVHPDVKAKTGGVGTWDRVLVDATWPSEWEPREEWGGLRHPMPCQAEPARVAQVHKRWSEYGFTQPTPKR